MFLGSLSHGMAMPVFFLLCRFIDRYVHIVGEGDGVKKVYMEGYLDNQLMLLGWLSHGMAMPVADVDGPFIISEITNKLIFGWTIVSSSFQDFAYCGTRELIFSNPVQKFFLPCRFIDRYVHIIEEGDGVKKVYMDGYLDNQLMFLGWLSHGMAMPVADADGPFIISEITNKLIFGWTIVSSSFQDFAYCGTRELIFSNPVQKFFLLCRFIDRYVHIVGEGDGVKKVYMDGYLNNELMFLGWLSHGMAMPVADADGLFIISEITNKLIFGWTIVSSSFKDFAYCGTRDLIFSNRGWGEEGDGVKKVYMEGYLDNQLMLLRWLSHGMAMPVADVDGPFIISEITNKLIFGWTIVSSSFQDFAYCGTRELIFSNPVQKFFLPCRFIDRYVHIVGEGDGVKKVYMDGYLDNQLMFLGWLSHGMAMPVEDADGPFIISEITNKLIFGWTIVSSSFQDFAYCGTRELIFSNPLWNGDGVKEVYMEGYLDNQLMLLGWLSHGMAMPVADVDGPFIISEITTKLVFGWTIVSSSFQDFAYCEWLSHGMAMLVADADGPFIISEITNKLILGGLLCHRLFKISLTVALKVFMVGYLDNQLMLLGWLSHGMVMPVAYADGPFIISEITNKLVFGWTIVSSSFQDFAYCCTRELIFSNPAQKLFLLCRFIDRYMQIVGEGDGVKKVYMEGYLDNLLMLLGWLSHGMAMPVADVDGPFIISEITNKLIFGWTIVSSSFQDFAYCGTRELIFSNPVQKFFLPCRFIDRYVHIVGEGDGVKKVYMDGYLDNQLMFLGWLSHGMAMPVADADGPFIISEITNKLIFGWTIVSSSFQDFAYCGTRELIFSNPGMGHGMAMPVAYADGDGVKKVYMEGYLDNQLMLLGWLNHGMAMPVADVDGPFIISEITNKLVFGWTIVSSSFQDFAYCGTRELIFSNPKVYMYGYLDNQLMFLGWLSHGMAMLVADADGPFIISEITNKLIFGWTIVSSSFQDFAYCGTREFIFSNPVQKNFLLCCFIDRYVQIVGEGDGVKKVFMDGYLDNQLMLLGWLSHGMVMPVAYADGLFIISEITNKLVFGWTIVSSSFQDFAYCCTRELIFSNPAQKLFLLCRFIDRYMQIVGEGDGVKKVYMDGYLDNQLMLLGWLSHGMAMPVADVDGPFIIS
ncbi:hypothetical protein CASFOL_022470 [Castilleja foliolosa]|uniref:Uncharacterized protein n=1 Tax=Castilleja foliolosa TaxID=1961234 RepID=A0ABD3CVK4_9LAMI